MSQKISKVMLLCTSCALFTTTGYTGDFTNLFSGNKSPKKPEIITKQIEPKAFAITKGDSLLTIGGKAATEYYFQKNAAMLNNRIPDEAGYFKQSIDVNAHIDYGEQKYGHKALEIETEARFKAVWGKIGYSSQTDSESVQVDHAIVGAHKHKTSSALIWLRKAWLKASFNAMFDFNPEHLHFIKIGMYPFQLGRGIALGDSYGTSKDFLGIYSTAANYFSPGILFTGEILDNLSYDLYYAKLEDKSATFNDTFNSDKEKIIGRKDTPWAGVAKDSDLIAGRLRIKIESDKFGNLDLEPYIFYNEASDQKVEVKADSKSMLGAIGVGAEYKKNNFEIGGEVALNYGHENLFHIDRNLIKIQMIKYDGEAYESLREIYSKVTFANGANSGIAIPVTTDTKAAITNSSNITNNASWSYNGVDYQNASNRFRPEFRNEYRGWMGVVDASYNFDKYDLKPAICYGYASGDKNPHVEEVNKTYHGFVSLQEFYPGKRVPSIIILDKRSIKRPLELEVNKAISDTTFSDIHFVGAGFTWTPKSLKEQNVSVNPNALLFWKDYRSHKYDILNHQTSTTEFASKFLGTEFNVKASYDLLKNLKAISALAVFVPGGYYNDIKGTPLSGDLMDKLELSDESGIDTNAYRINNDPCYYAQFGLEYKF